MGSFCHHDPIAAAHVGRDYSHGKSIEIRKAFQDLLDNVARLQDGERGVCGGGCRAAEGKAKLVPPPPGNGGSHFSRV